jgi:hypothetical protein
VIRVALVTVGLAALLVCAVVGVLVYHAVAADRAQDVPASPAVVGAFEEAGRSWQSHMDLPVRRLALLSAEEYGSGVYLFVFDVYHWFGIGSGYMTYGPEGRGCGGGGLTRNGGFAGIGDVASPDDVLSETRLQCTQAYGPGRVAAPAFR